MSIQSSLERRLATENVWHVDNGAHSGASRRMNSRSIAAEKAANARPPPKAAFGPEFRASTPPATKPDDTELYMSFLARYYRRYQQSRSYSEHALTDSIMHSMPANNAPTFPNPFPLVHIPFPISLKTSLAF